MIDTVVRVGNSSGADVNKFKEFALTPGNACKVKAPLLRECHANFECRIYDDTLIDKYNFFIFEVVHAHVAVTPKYPKTLHYTGDGVFTLSGRAVSRRTLFKPGML
jgi:flavin reductase (DIM6/NTAB) family NADH-FMN oxidoreductase RutF